MTCYLCHLRLFIYFFKYTMSLGRTQPTAVRAERSAPLLCHRRPCLFIRWKWTSRSKLFPKCRRWRDSATNPSIIYRRQIAPQMSCCGKKSRLNPATPSQPWRANGFHICPRVDKCHLFKRGGAGGGVGIERFLGSDMAGVCGFVPARCCEEICRMR